MGPIGISNSDTKHAGEVWDSWRLVILALKSLFCMHKTTDEGLDQ